MVFKIGCLILALAVACYGTPYVTYGNGNQANLRGAPNGPTAFNGRNNQGEFRYPPNRLPSFSSAPGGQGSYPKREPNYSNVPSGQSGYRSAPIVQPNIGGVPNNRGGFRNVPVSPTFRSGNSGQGGFRSATSSQNSFQGGNTAQNSFQVVPTSQSGFGGRQGNQGFRGPPVQRTFNNNPYGKGYSNIRVAQNGN